LVLSVLLAAAQGFLHEVISLAGVVLGYLLAAWEYWRIAPRIAPYVKSQALAESVGFLAIFFAVVIAAGIIGRMARWLAREAGLGWADRLLGAIFGLVRGAAIVAVLVLALAAFAPGSRMLGQSSFGGYFLVAARGMSWLAPVELRQKLRQGVEAMRQLPQQPKTGVAGDSGKASGSQTARH
jgi:membrane protein required for colicin V production